MYIYNPIYNKFPQGPSLKGKEVVYKLKINKNINSTAVNFCYCKDFENIDKKLPMQVNEIGDFLEYSVKVIYSQEGLYWYYFEVYQSSHKFFLQATSSFDVEPTGNLTTKFQQTVYFKKSSTTSSFKGGVMYHIFVDRFCKKGKVVPRFDLVLRDDWGGELYKGEPNYKKINKECFGGNLKGIISKLDYLKSLNVNTIYLSPIFEANSYHKYNTADYSKIDSMFGSEKDLTQLISKAKNKGINIILDGVFNHTGDDSIYFNRYNRYNSTGAYQSKDSKFFNWFSFDVFPNKYSSWWGIESLPQIKKPSQDFNRFIGNKNGIIEKFMKLGLLGFRLDVVDELNEQTLETICKAIRKTNKQGIVLGEVWEDASNKIAYESRKNYFTKNQLDSVMNYPVKDAIINYLLTKDCTQLKNTLFMIIDHYPKEVQDNLMNILDTHDTARIKTVLKNNLDEKNTLKLLKIATLLQYCIVGNPCIFYGDEQGVEGGEAPLCRVCFPWNKQNKILKNWYVLLGKLRKNIVFKKGTMNIKICENGLFGIERLDGRNKVVVYTNVSESPKEITLGDCFYNFETKKKVNKIKLLSNNYAILVNRI